MQSPAMQYRCANIRPGALSRTSDTHNFTTETRKEHASQRQGTDGVHFDQPTARQRTVWFRHQIFVRSEPLISRLFLPLSVVGTRMPTLSNTSLAYRTLPTL